MGRGLQRFGDGIAAVGAKLGDMFHELGEQLRRNMCVQTTALLATSRISHPSKF